MISSALTVTGTESYQEAIRLGPGLAQVPYFHVAENLRSGCLRQILPTLPTTACSPVSLVFTGGHQLSLQVRVFLD